MQLFALFVFPTGPSRTKGDYARIQEGVRSWSKMKSRGGKKEGKLAQHFSSAAHKAALEDC